MACASDRADQQHRARQGETPGHHPERGAGTGQARERRGENGAERDRPRTERAHGRGEPAEERWRAVLLAEAPDEDVSDAKAGTHRERAGRDEDDPPAGLCERDQEPEGHAREHGGHERPGGSEPPSDAKGSGGARQPADASEPDHGPGDARGEVQGANEEGDLQGLPPGEAEVRHGPERHEDPQVRVGSHEAEPRRDLLDEPPCLDARPGLPPAREERVEAGNGEAEAHRGQGDGSDRPRELGDHACETGPDDLRAGAARLERPVCVEQLAALDDGGHDQVRRGPGKHRARTGDDGNRQQLGHAEHAERRGDGQAPEREQAAEVTRHHDGSGLPAVDPGPCWETNGQEGHPGCGMDEPGRGGARVEHLTARSGRAREETAFATPLAELAARKNRNARDPLGPRRSGWARHLLPVTGPPAGAAPSTPGAGRAVSPPRLGWRPSAPAPPRPPVRWGRTGLPGGRGLSRWAEPAPGAPRARSLPHAPCARAWGAWRRGRRARRPRSSSAAPRLEPRARPA